VRTKGKGHGGPGLKFLQCLEKKSGIEWQRNFDIKSSYIIAQVSNIVCKKDHHKILSNTVSERLSEGYEKLVSQKIIFLKSPHGDTKVQAVMVPKDAHRARKTAQKNVTLLTKFLEAASP
jgi:hypothetical protein